MEEKDLTGRLEEAFKELPKVVQNSITSAEVEKKLRELSETHKLHLDQWQKLENEVMLTLLGFQPAEKLEENIKNEVGVSAEVANALTGDIAEAIFQPIRDELERETDSTAPAEKSAENPTPEKNTVTALEVIPTAVIPATPPPPAPIEKAIRAPMSSSYTSQAPSHERNATEGDPYREPIA